MSDFKNLSKNICLPEKEPKEPQVVCPPVEEVVPKEDKPYYDSKKKRYYVVQTMDSEGNFLKSSEATQENVSKISSAIGQEALKRIIKYFNFNLSEEEIEKAPVILEDYEVYEMALKPVGFLFYVEEKYLKKEKKDTVEKPPQNLEAVVLPGKDFFSMLEQLESKLNIFSKYQSALFSFDKIKILKENGEPFYLSLVVSRLTEFKNKFKEFLTENGVDLAALGDIELYVEPSEVGKQIKDLTIDNKNLKKFNDELTIGLQEFLDSPFFKDADMVNFVLNLTEMTKNLNGSWIDLIIKNGVNLKLDNFFSDFISSIPCFPDFDISVDSILDLDLSFFERLEFSLGKKNSTFLADVLTPPSIMLPKIELGVPQGVEDLLSDLFKNANKDTAKLEGLNFDDPFAMLLEALEDFSFEPGGFEPVYQFLGPGPLSLMLTQLFDDFAKMLNPEELLKLITDTFLDSLDLDGFLGILDKLPPDIQNNFMNTIKDLLDIDLGSLDLDGLFKGFKMFPPELKLDFLKGLKFDHDWLPSGVDPLAFLDNLKFMPPDIKLDFLREIKLEAEINFDFLNFGQMEEIIFALPEIPRNNFLEKAHKKLRIVNPFENFKLNFSSILPNFDWRSLLPDLKLEFFKLPDIDIANIFPKFGEIPFADFVENFAEIFKNLDFASVFNKFKDTFSKFPELDILDFPDIGQIDPLKFLDGIENPFEGLDIDFNLALPRFEKTAAKFPEFNLPEFKFPEFPDIGKLSIEEFKLELPDFMKDFDFKMLLPELKNVFKNFPDLDIFSDLPEFDRIASILDIISIPNIDLTSPLEFLDSLGTNFTIFDPSFLKIPDIPDLPSLKFSIVSFIQDNLFSVLKIVIEKIAALIINKLVGFIKNMSLDGLTNGIPLGSLGDFNPLNGLSEFVGTHLCKDDPMDLNPLESKEEKDPNDATDALLKNIVPSEEISDEAYKQLAIKIGESSSVLDIINAVIEDDDKINETFIQDLTEVIQTSAPEFKEKLKDSKDTKNMFRKIRDYISPETLDTLKKYKDNYEGFPIEHSKCVTKEQQNIWKSSKRVGLQEKGFAGEAAQKYVDDKMDKAKDQTKDILDLLTNDIGKNLSDSIEDILNENPDCDNLYKSPEAKEIISEQRKKMKKVENEMLEKINLTFTSDLLENSPFDLLNNKGTLSKILSDKYGRNMGLIMQLKQNFITSLLMTLEVIPKPDFADTIGKALTDKLAETMEYEEREETYVFNDTEIKDFSSFFNFIKYTEEEIQIKQSDLSIPAPEDTGGVAVEYIDYGSGSFSTESEFRYFIKVGNDFLVNSNLQIPSEISAAYPDIVNLPKWEYMTLLGLSSQDYSRELWSENNSQVFADQLKESLKLHEEISFGYPEEVTEEILNKLQEEFTNTGDITSVVEGFENIQLLDPETYGSFFGQPKFYANQNNLPPGFYKDSKDFFDKKVDNKLNKTILNLESVSNFIDKYSGKLDKNKYMETSPEDLADSPFDKVDAPKKLANAQGMIKTYVRVFLAEYAILANNVFKNFGFSIDESTFASYIMEKMKYETKSLKLPSKSVYSQFVTYVLMLVSNAEAYKTMHTDDMSKAIKDLDDNFEPLQKKQIKSLKETAIFKSEKQYENYILGYYGISFGEKYKFIYDQADMFPLSSSNMTTAEIKFASKLGYALKNIDFLEEVMHKTIENEIKEYAKMYPAKQNIYEEYLKVITGEEQLFVLDRELQQIDWQTKAYYTLIQKNGTEQQITKQDLIQTLESLSNTDKEKYISELYGNAILQGNSYSGTIGLKYGIGLFLNFKMVSNFEQDFKDMTINELLTFLESNDVENPDCYVDNFFMTNENQIIFDLSFQIKKLPTIIAIYYIENMLSSINKGVGEGAPDFTSIVGGTISKIIGLGRTINFMGTKKEIKRTFLDNYVREFYDPSSEEEEGFFDFKALEMITNSFDVKNFSVDNAPSMLQKSQFLDKVPLDAEGLPVVNSFLGNFK